MENKSMIQNAAGAIVAPARQKDSTFRCLGSRMYDISCLISCRIL